MNNSILYNIHDIYLIIKDNLKFVIKCSITFLFLGILYTLMSTKYYESHISIYPENSDSNNINNIMGMTSMFGVDLNDNMNSSFYIPDVVNSRRLKVDIVDKKWKSEKFSNSVNLIEYWGLNNEGESFFNIFQQKNFDKNRIYQENAIGQLENNLYVFEEESGLIKIRVLMEEPQLAADIANYISNFLIRYIGTELKLKSTKYRKFLEERLVEVERELEKAEEDLTEFRSKNPIAKDTPVLQNIRGKFIRNLEVEQQVYLTLRTQYEIARADELKEQPVINILDSAYPSPHPYWPNNMLIYLLSSFIGFMVSIIFISTKKILSKKI